MFVNVFSSLRSLNDMRFVCVCVCICVCVRVWCVCVCVCSTESANTVVFIRCNDRTNVGRTHEIPTEKMFQTARRAHKHIATLVQLLQTVSHWRTAVRHRRRHSGPYTMFVTSRRWRFSNIMWFSKGILTILRSSMTTFSENVMPHAMEPKLLII